MQITDKQIRMISSKILGDLFDNKLTRACKCGDECQCGYAIGYTIENRLKRELEMLGIHYSSFEQFTLTLDCDGVEMLDFMQELVCKQDGKNVIFTITAESLDYDEDENGNLIEIIEPLKW